MLKIAVCDDSRADLAMTISLIDDYASQKAGRCVIDCTPFDNAIELLSAMERGQIFDLVFLDIIMPITSGMDAATEIRQFNKEVKIVFLTSSTEFAVDSYSVNAYYYLLKPVGKTKLASLLDGVVSAHETQSGTGFVLKAKTGLTRVYFSNLEFAEVLGRTIIYHMADASTVEAVGSMIELEKRLTPENGFVKPHRSFIINLAYIDTLEQRRITMRTRAVVPMSKANYSGVKSAYFSHTFSFCGLNRREIG